MVKALEKLEKTPSCVWERQKCIVLTVQKVKSFLQERPFRSIDHAIAVERSSGSGSATLALK
jgi:hypothetical protein